MSLRKKLTFSLLFLFLIIVAVGAVGSYYLNLLANVSSAIIKDNYRTMSYMYHMDNDLDDILQMLPIAKKDSMAFSVVDSSVKHLNREVQFQTSNVTEAGESHMTLELANSCSQLTQEVNKYLTDSSAVLNGKIQSVIFTIKPQLDNIYELNQEAIVRKNDHAAETAGRVVMYMAIFSASGFVLGLLLLLGVPGYITRPIRTFNEAIKEVSRGNYNVKVNLKKEDEYSQLAKSFNKMSAKLQEYESSNYARVLYEKKRLDAVINQLNEGVIGLDQNKHILFANRLAMRLLGVTLEEIAGQYAPDVAVNNQLMQRLLSGLMVGSGPEGEISEKPLKIVDNNEEKLFTHSLFHITERPTGDDRDILIGHVIILNDVTEYVRRDEAKTHFMHILSRELNNPSGAIEKCAALLEAGELGDVSAEQTKIIDKIRDNNQRIQRVVSEILDISNLESGAVDVITQHVRPEQLVEKAIEGVERFLGEKDLEITVQRGSNLKPVIVDPHKAVWILNNFLTNAIRYAPEGTHIEMGIESDGRELEISVTDHGPGIPEDNQQRIFRKFSRLQEDEEGGTGLGLAISKEFAEAMHGRVGVRSISGKGSTFWVRFRQVLS